MVLTYKTDRSWSSWGSCSAIYTTSVRKNDLTHWDRDKMTAISQTTFSNAFSWMKMYAFWLRFHWSLSLRAQLTIVQHWFRKWFGAVQATDALTPFLSSRGHRQPRYTWDGQQAIVIHQFMKNSINYPCILMLTNDRKCKYIFCFLNTILCIILCSLKQLIAGRVNMYIYGTFTCL